MTMPITTSTAMNRSRASFTRMMKSNHHQAFRQPVSSAVPQAAFIFEPSSVRRFSSSRVGESFELIIVLSFVRSRTGKAERNGPAHVRLNSAALRLGYLPGLMNREPKAVGD